MTMHHIASSVVSGSSVSTLDFNSIPQTYTHLHIRTSLRMQSSQSTPYDLTITVNGSTYSNQFSFHRLSSDGASASGTGYINDLLFRVPLIIPNAYHLSNVFGASSIELLDYTNSAKGKTLKAVGGYDNNGGSNPYAGWINLTSSGWTGTSPITSLQFASFGNFAIGSRVDIYGLTSNTLSTGA